MLALGGLRASWLYFCAQIAGGTGKVKGLILTPGCSGQETIFSVARRYGQSPTQLFRWPREMRKQLKGDDLAVSRVTTFVPPVVDVAAVDKAASWSSAIRSGSVQSERGDKGQPRCECRGYRCGDRLYKQQQPVRNDNARVLLIHITYFNRRLVVICDQGKRPQATASSADTPRPGDSVIYAAADSP